MSSLLTVEAGALADTTGVNYVATRTPGANSYCDADFATTYLSAYESASFDDWPTDTTQQEQALLVGCMALELNYRDKWLSTRLLPQVNALTWPRFTFYDRNVILVLEKIIPLEVMQAQATFALYYVQGIDVFPQKPKDQHTIEDTAKVGDLSVTKRYTAGAPFEVFRKLDLLLWRITRGMSGAGLVR